MFDLARSIHWKWKPKRCVIHWLHCQITANFSGFPMLLTALILAIASAAWSCSRRLSAPRAFLTLPRAWVTPPGAYEGLSSFRQSFAVIKTYAASGTSGIARTLFMVVWVCRLLRIETRSQDVTTRDSWCSLRSFATSGHTD